MPVYNYSENLQKLLKDKYYFSSRRGKKKEEQAKLFQRFYCL